MDMHEWLMARVDFLNGDTTAWGKLHKELSTKLVVQRVGLVPPWVKEHFRKIVCDLDDAGCRRVLHTALGCAQTFSFVAVLGELVFPEFRAAFGRIGFLAGRGSMDILFGKRAQTHLFHFDTGYLLLDADLRAQHWHRVERPSPARTFCSHPVSCLCFVWSLGVPCRVKKRRSRF
tara:strand:+ start:63 stop:587 length:525 start_codon:yes stop_codon:yes gene_type:complete